MADLITKETIQNKALSLLGTYPELAKRIRAGDVYITQQIGAMAQMLELLSYQLSLAETEPWTKARPIVVKADAIAKGILPYAKPAQWRVNINNKSQNVNNIVSGRRLLDSQGRIWIVTNGASVQPGALGQVEIKQEETEVFEHTISRTENFYKIQVPQPQDNKYISGVKLVRKQDNQEFEFYERYNNVNYGDLVYHLLSDEEYNLFIEFGVKDVAGYVPVISEVFEITIYTTYGTLTIPNAAKFNFEYVFFTQTDENTEIYAESAIYTGANPFTIADLRELTGFPSMYDESSVYLGNFHFLIMRNHHPFKFLSVWNEQIEERVRGANVNNINKLFITFVKDDQTYAAAQANIERTVYEADNSYKIVWVDVVEEEIPIDVKLRLSPVHDEASVFTKIQLFLLAEFGRDSIWARRGRARINWRDTTDRIKDAVVELQDNKSDITLSVDEPTTVLPEVFRYATANSISITNIPLVVY